MASDAGRRPRAEQSSADPRKSFARVEDIVLIAMCCVAVLALLTLVGAGLGSLLGAL